MPTNFVHAAAIVLLLAVAETDATWSVLAGDTESKRLGVAIAMCISIEAFAKVLFDKTSFFVPGKAAIVAQATLQTPDGLFALASKL